MSPSSTPKIARMRQLLESGRIIVSPGVYDGYSLRLVELAGYETASTSGAGLVNTRLSQPDIGVMSLLENVEACRNLARSVSIPLMADADTGYGNALSVYETARYFEEAGVVGINIEDQTYPKRCGHMKGKELVSPAEMAKKIEAAKDAVSDKDFIINARTDSIDVEGIDAAVRRAELYAKAGADMIFPDAIRGEDDIKRFVDLGVPISINMGFGIRSRPTTPLISIPRLEELGVARVSLPRMLPAAAIQGMRLALDLMKKSIETGEIIDRPDLLASISEITDLMGYEFVNNLEQKYLLPEQLEQKYGDESPTSWVQEFSDDSGENNG